MFGAELKGFKEPFIPSQASEVCMMPIHNHVFPLMAVSPMVPVHQHTCFV